MSKRFNSLLFGALAALLLCAPVQAQDFATKARASKSVPVAKVIQPMKKADVYASKEFSKLTQKEQDDILKKAEVSETEVSPVVNEPVKSVVERLPQMLPGKAQKGNVAIEREARTTPLMAPSKAADETVDANGIIIAPAEGEQKFYTRAGMAYYVSGQQIYYGSQSATVEIVECEDGTVYVKDLISYYTNGAWVKGVKEDNTLTFNVGQPVNYNSTYAATLSIYWGSYSDEEGFYKNADAETITFTIDGDVISLNGSDEDNYIGIFWDDDDSFSGYGDFETVWTLYDYVPASTDPIEVPEGLETATWFVQGTEYASSSIVPFATTATVGFDGDDIYVQGLFTDFPEAWVKGTKGTKDGNTVIFSKFQFLGVYYDEYNIWAVGYDVNTGELVDCVMYLDEETGTLTMAEDNYFVANAAEDRLYYLQLFMTLSITSDFEEPEAETGDPVDELPYTNSFDTEEEQADFGTINANMDDKGWNLYEIGTGNYGMRYMYSGTNSADDWLVSPAIYMETGKFYHLAFDMVTGSYTERVEVKMGTGTKASDFTQTIIEAEEYATGGQFITLENEGITVEESGYYHIGIHAISDPDEYYIIVDNFFFEAGADPTAPAAVAELTIESFEGSEVGATISFTAPTTAINGTELTENIAYINLLRDGVVIKVFENVAPGEQITYVDNAEGLTPGYHTYQVIPYDENGIGMKSDIITVFLKQIMSVPFTADLTQESVFKVFTAIDANEDGKNWTWNASIGTYAPYTSSTVQPDDYLISLPVQLVAGKRYNLVVNLRGNSTIYSERFEVLLGTDATPEAMTITAIEPTELTTNVADDYEGEFMVPEDGNYYVAIHHISDPDQYYLIVNTLSIEPGLLDDAPAAPRLAVQPDPYGAEKAVLTVTAPGRDIMGAKLTKKIDFMNIYRDGQLIKSFENVAPQGIKVFTDNDLYGVHTYQAVCYDADGNRGMKSEKKSVFIGLDIPAPLETVNAQELADGVNLSWKGVTTGMNGGIVVPGEIGYDVWTGHIEYVWGIFPILYLDDIVATTNTNSVFVPYDANADQSLESLYVLPHNEAGSPDEDYATQVMFYVGAPFTMPFEEHFSASGFDYGTWLYNASSDVELTTTADASDEDGGALIFTSYSEDEYGWLTAGKVKLHKGNPTLMVDVKGDAGNSLKIYVETPDGDVELEGSFAVTDEYETVSVALGDYANEDYIKFRIYADFATEGSMIIDNVRIIDLLEYNLTVKMKAPKAVQAGNIAPVLVNVKNLGQNAANGYSVVLYANDEEVYYGTINEVLLPFQSTDFEIEYVTTIFDDAQDVTLRAEVEYELDMDDEDNVAESIITVKQSTAAQPENVVAEKTENGVKLSWDAPANAAEEVVENFDDQDTFVPFSLGGIDENNRYGALGDWTLYDGNNSTVYGFNGISFENAYQIQAWQVAYPADFGGEETYAPHSGDQFLWSFCPVDEDGNTPACDHWLISPTLTGDAQTISFWYRTITEQYGPETFEVWYSTTDNQVESFEKLAEYTTDVTEWTELSIDLPAGAQFFAIRHTSVDIFGLLIDDVTYATSGGSISNYNVYVEQELYDDTTETSIEIANTTAKVFAVSAVYATGVESKPVVVVLEGGNQQMTAIEQITGSKQAVDVYSIDGKLVRQHTLDLQGLKGAYIINGQTVILK